MVHVSAVAKNAADDKLRVSLRRFADTYDSPATVVMVTSDVNFSNDLHDLRHRHMFTVVLVHNQQVSYALKACAHMTVVFEDFLIDIPNREQDAVSNSTSNHQYITSPVIKCSIHKTGYEFLTFKSIKILCC